MSIQYEKVFKMLDTILLSRFMPPNALSEPEIKFYLNVLAQLFAGTGASLSGRNSYIAKVKAISPQIYKQLQENLINAGFISICEPANPNCTSTIKHLLFPPLYYNDEFIQLNDLKYTKSNIKDTKKHFGLIPYTALIKALRYPWAKMLVLLKLYRYNDYAIFRGVDPNVLRFEGGKLNIHSKFAFDLYLTDNEVEECINELVDAGMLLLEDVTVYKEIFDTEERLRLFNDGVDFNVEMKSITLIVPYYQIESIREGETDQECNSLVQLIFEDLQEEELSLDTEKMKRAS